MQLEVIVAVIFHKYGIERIIVLRTVNPVKHRKHLGIITTALNVFPEVGNCVKPSMLSGDFRIVDGDVFSSVERIGKQSIKGFKVVAHSHLAIHFRK